MTMDQARIWMAHNPGHWLEHDKTGYVYWMQHNGQIFRQTSPGYTETTRLDEGKYKQLPAKRYRWVLQEVKD